MGHGDQLGPVPDYQAQQHPADWQVVQMFANLWSRHAGSANDWLSRFTGIAKYGLGEWWTAARAAGACGERIMALQPPMITF
jgi:hypothetical protein